MYIRPFAVEEWMNKWEDNAIYNIAETCVDSISINELFELAEENKEEFLQRFCSKRLTYGAIFGAQDFKKEICRLYHTIGESDILTTHGAAGANHHVFYSLISPGDRVISIMPTYQQLYSIPEGYGADMQIIHLEKENGYLPDLDELRRLATPETRLICINNPNNPSGALMDNDYLQKIVDIAREVDAYILCDEVYRHLTQEDVWIDSIADLYEKGISVSSMSKVFSLAGLRLGWIACRDQEFMTSCASHRDYNLISCGMFDEAIATIALRASHKILARNKKIIRDNLAILDQWIQNENHLSYVKPQAGTTCLVYYDFPKDSYEFCEEMYHKTGAFVTPGDCFEEPYCMRIGYASDTETLKAGLNAISQYVRMLENAERKCISGSEDQEQRYIEKTEDTFQRTIETDKTEDTLDKDCCGESQE